jgi:hypothetical protein
MLTPTRRRRRILLRIVLKTIGAAVDTAACGW